MENGQYLLSLDDVARFLNVSQKTVHRLITDNKLEKVQVTSRTVRVTSSSVLKFIEAKGVEK